MKLIIDPRSEHSLAPMRPHPPKVLAQRAPFPITLRKNLKNHCLYFNLK